MFRRRKVVKRCPKGHEMEPTWRRCPRCRGGRVPLQRARDLAEATVFEAPGEGPVDATRVGSASQSREPAAPQETGPALVGTAGPVAGREFPLAMGMTRIGKAPKPASDTVLIAVPEDRYMSKEHATLTLGSAALVLSDPGSTNGTFVNGSRVNRALLQDGDELRLGESAFRVRLPR